MKAYHTLVTGPSGAGKSTLLKQMHAEFDGVSVFLTTKTRSREKGVAGKEVSGRRAMDSAVQSAESWSDVRVKWYEASYPEATETARAFAQEVREYSGQPVQIIVDECQNTPLPSSEGALKDGLHEDRDAGIKWVPSTQSPQDLKENRGYKGINQCPYITWCGGARVFQSGFIDHYKLDGLLPDEKYHYHVIQPSRPPEVVYRGETDPKYG